MLAEKTKQYLTDIARQICDGNDVSQAYFVQILGKRRHYLAGFGDTTFSQPEHMDIGENVALYWHGSLNKSKRKTIENILRRVIVQVGKELS